MEDIAITSDVEGIVGIKGFLQGRFQPKDLDNLIYFLEIEFTRPKDGIFIC